MRQLTIYHPSTEAAHRASDIAADIATDAPLPGSGDRQSHLVIKVLQPPQPLSPWARCLVGCDWDDWRLSMLSKQHARLMVPSLLGTTARLASPCGTVQGIDFGSSTDSLELEQDAQHAVASSRSFDSLDSNHPAGPLSQI